MKLYDVAVVGAGPAGMMAAIRIGQLGKSVVLIEKNDILGKKLKITGSSRCNITNTASFDIFMEKFGKRGSFFRSAFSTFSSKRLMTFFKAKGLKFKVEDNGRVFPITDRSRSVIKVLKEYLLENNVIRNYNTRLINIKKKKDYFSLDLGNDNYIATKSIILATGGVFYKATGSTGDGLDIAQKMGHNITPLKPGLVPLKLSDPWVKELQGISLKNIRIKIKYGKKNIISNNGNLIFTHFGISGPLVLDWSNQIISILEKTEAVQFFLDLKPEMTIQEIEEKLIKEFEISRKSEFKNFMKFLLPNRMIPIFVDLLGINPKKKVNQIEKEERNSIINLLKAFPLTIIDSMGVNKAMITCGGISRSEINPQTLESKLIKNLYFAGEIIEGCASSGGYNLQQAFSTGYLAGESAANES